MENQRCRRRIGRKAPDLAEIKTMVTAIELLEVFNLEPGTTTG